MTAFTLSTSLVASLPAVGSSLLAVAAFSLVLLCPGYVFAWTSDLFQFRSKSQAERVVWSVPLSLCVVTITAVLLGKLLSVGVLCWLAAALGLAFASIFLWELRRGSIPKAGLGRSGRWALAILAAWTLFAIFELIDIPSGSRLFMSSVVYDHALRTAFVDAVARTGVPPANPLYWPGHASPMRYYYFWYVLCAMVVKLAGVSARSALIASCVWSGFGLASLIALFTRYFDDGPPDRIRRRVLTAMALLTVTGLDLLPLLGSVAAGKHLVDPEWWSLDQVTSWLDALLWVPHHLAAVICCLTGFLLIWLPLGERRRWLVAVVAGAGFAGAFGLSTWVALGFAILMCGWLAWLLATGFSRTRRPAARGGSGHGPSPVAVSPRTAWRGQGGSRNYHDGSTNPPARPRHAANALHGDALVRSRFQVAAPEASIRRGATRRRRAVASGLRARTWLLRGRAAARPASLANPGRCGPNRADARYCLPAPDRAGPLHRHRE